MVMIFLHGNRNPKESNPLLLRVSNNKQERIGSIAGLRLEGGSGKKGMHATSSGWASDAWGGTLAWVTKV